MTRVHQFLPAITVPMVGLPVSLDGFRAAIRHDHRGQLIVFRAITVVGGEHQAGTGTTDRWFNAAAFATPAAFTFGNVGRNTVFGPGMQTMDLGLMRTIAIGEKARVELRAESFNALNHSNWGTPNRFVNTPQFGSITEASTPGREFQLSARVSF